MDPLNDLERDLQRALGHVTVAPVEHLLEVSVPDPAVVHEQTVLYLSAQEGQTWRITDAGAVGFSTGIDVSDLVAVMQCSGVVPEVAEEDGHLVFLAHSDDLVDHVHQVVQSLRSANLLWAAHECGAARDQIVPRDQPRARVMAQRCRNHLAQRDRRANAVTFLGHRIIGKADEPLNVPLAVAAKRDAPPRLVASFIDETTEQASSAGKRNTAWMLDVVSDLTIPKYVVVDKGRVDHFAEVYDAANVTTVSASDYGTMPDDVLRIIAEWFEGDLLSI